nr:RNA-directed DNA polymerase, eukaryota [Tanacetum cinerariifolium]
MKLQEALDEESILEEQMLALMHGFADRFMDRRVEINNLMVLHDHPLNDYEEVKAAGLDKNTTGINESSGVGGEKLDSVSVGSRNCKKVDIKRTGGSLLTVMEELIKVGKTMGYNMEGCMKNIEEIIEIQGVEEVFR